jgi:ABC-type uncharacterized transport system permease subunit
MVSCGNAYGGSILRSAPLVFFPGALQKVVLALPFAVVYSTPLLIYLGTIPPSRYLVAMTVQLGWFVVFAALAAVIWRAAQHRVVV